MPAGTDHIDGSSLETYVRRRLPDTRTAAIEEHLIACPDCRGRLMGWGEFVRVQEILIALAALVAPDR